MTWTSSFRLFAGGGGDSGTLSSTGAGLEELLRAGGLNGLNMAFPQSDAWCRVFECSNIETRLYAGQMAWRVSLDGASPD